MQFGNLVGLLNPKQKTHLALGSDPDQHANVHTVYSGLFYFRRQPFSSLSPNYRMTLTCPEYSFSCAQSIHKNPEINKNLTKDRAALTALSKTTAVPVGVPSMDPISNQFGKG